MTRFGLTKFGTSRASKLIWARAAETELSTRSSFFGSSALQLGRSPDSTFQTKSAVCRFLSVILRKPKSVVHDTRLLNFSAQSLVFHALPANACMPEESGSEFLRDCVYVCIAFIAVQIFIVRI